MMLVQLTIQQFLYVLIFAISHIFSEDVCPTIQLFLYILFFAISQIFSLKPFTFQIIGAHMGGGGEGEKRGRGHLIYPLKRLQKIFP
jgi:hypothetical protein